MTPQNDNILTARILAKTNEYLDFPSVVGHESPFLDHLARDFASLGVKVNRSQNICHIDLGGKGPLFMAHVDRHGAVSADDGAMIYAAYAVKNEKYGETVTPSPEFAEMVSQRYLGEEMFAYDRKTGGRIAYGDVAGAEVDAQGRLVMTIDGLPPLQPNTPMAFARHLRRVDGAYITGQLDNPISAAVLRIMAEHGLKGQIVFTAEEEIGRSAEHFIHWADQHLSETPNIIVLDTTPFDDAAGALAGAVVLRRRDATSSFQEQAVIRLEKAAQQVPAPIIFKDAFIEAENKARARRDLPPKSLGMTELGRIIAQSKGRYSGATLQIPTFNYHTNQESTTPKALVAFARTLTTVQKLS
ncbi:zinc-binding metallopeptidase family protein [Woodsholea maritima]|uniref:hypothetical protein n=1 Tax=Woodsholea maritima TaxID=240237 RepID=UPI0003711034|nr:hypothetical protein [Woodsholea maritima]